MEHGQCAEHTTFPGNEFTAGPAGQHFEVLQITDKDKIGSATGSDGTSIVHPVTFRGIEGSHAHGVHRVHPQLYSKFEDSVDMPALQDVRRLTIIRAEKTAAGIAGRDSGQELLHFTSGRAFTQEDVHPASHAVAQFLIR